MTASLFISFILFQEAPVGKKKKKVRKKKIIYKEIVLFLKLKAFKFQCHHQQGSCIPLNCVRV